MQHVDIADSRHIREHALLIGQQARREQRQGRVLVALDHDPSGQPAASLDFQLCHRSSDPFAHADDFFPKLDPELCVNLRLASIDQRSNVTRRCAAFIHDEVRVRRRNPRRPLRGALEPGAVDQRSCRRRNPVRHAVSAGSGF